MLNRRAYLKRLYQDALVLTKQVRGFHGAKPTDYNNNKGTGGIRSRVVRNGGSTSDESGQKLERC